MMRTLAIVTARGGSKRLPGKNIRPFLGKPLIHWTLEFAKCFPHFTEIVVSTDSNEIAQCCRHAGISVPWLRSEYLSGDEASSIDVVCDALARTESIIGQFDAIALLQPTSPIRIVDRWNKAFESMMDDEVRAVIGVGPALSHPYLLYKMAEDQTLTPYVPQNKGSVRSQDFPPLFQINGGMYWIKCDDLKKYRTFTPDGTRGIFCSTLAENIDIDTEFDWKIAELIVSMMEESQ